MLDRRGLFFSLHIYNTFLYILILLVRFTVSYKMYFYRSEGIYLANFVCRHLTWNICL
jgi:hypothetical protein